MVLEFRVIPKIPNRIGSEDDLICCGWQEKLAGVSLFEILFIECVFNRFNSIPSEVLDEVGSKTGRECVYSGPADGD